MLRHGAFQVGLAVTVLRSQRTAYDKLAEDNATILRMLGALKSADGNRVRFYCRRAVGFGAFEFGPKVILFAALALPNCCGR